MRAAPDDVAALIADMERGASANLTATDVRMHAAAAMLRRLSAPAGGDDARLCRALRLSPGEWESIELLNEDAAARIEQLSAQVTEYERERLARSKIDPITRMHNLCDHLAEHRNESPYNAEALELADASYKELCGKLKAAELLAQQRGEALRAVAIKSRPASIGQRRTIHVCRLCANAWTDDMPENHLPNCCVGHALAAQDKDANGLR